MKLTRGQIIATLSVLLTLLIAFLTNIVTSTLPSWIQSYTWLAWLLFIAALIALVITTIKGAASRSPAPLIDDDLLNHFVQVVSDAELKAQLDPGLHNIPYASAKLDKWKDIDIRLIRILGVNDNSDDWQPQKDQMLLARLVLRLTKAILPAMSQRGQWRELTDIAGPAYIIAETLKEWADATSIAYELAVRYHDASSSIQAKFWADRMEKSLKHVTSQTLSDGLCTRLFDIKGILARDYEGDLVTARKYLKDALMYAKRTRVPLLIWRVTTHLGILEKQELNLDKAIELYNEALVGASQIGDPGLTLECYQALGDLALLQDDAEKAYHWYFEQLTLATTSLRIIYKGRAHQGIAESLLKMNPPNGRQAYYYAREALRIEQEITGPRESELLILLVHIADMLWKQE